MAVLGTPPKIHLFERKAHQIHGRFGNTSHGIDITQGIGCGNLPKPVWIIYDWGEKVHRLDDGNVVGDSIYGCIVRPL